MGIGRESPFRIHFGWLENTARSAERDAQREVVVSVVGLPAKGRGNPQFGAGGGSKRADRRVRVTRCISSAYDKEEKATRDGSKEPTVVILSAAKDPLGRIEKARSGARIAILPSGSFALFAAQDDT